MPNAANADAAGSFERHLQEAIRLRELADQHLSQQRNSERSSFVYTVHGLLNQSFDRCQTVLGPSHPKAQELQSWLQGIQKAIEDM